MLPLSEELALAENELRMWARLHKTEDDSDIGIWRVLGTIGKAVQRLRETEETSEDQKG